MATIEISKIKDSNGDIHDIKDTTYTFTSGTNSFTYKSSYDSTATTVTVTPSITNNITGTGTSGYLTKFNGTNTITNGPQLGSSTTTFLNNKGEWATPAGTYSLPTAAAAVLGGVKVGTGLTISATGVLSHTAAPIGTTSSKGSSTARHYIKTITVDSLGHITGVTTGAETVTNTTYSAGDGLTLTGTTFKISSTSVTNAMLQNSSISIAGESVSLGGSLTAATLRQNLGLSSALRFLGTTTTTMSDGRTTAAVAINNTSTTPTTGDVVIYGDGEYVWTGSAWEHLGGDGSYKTIQSAVSDPTANGTSTSFIKTISQDANGVITASKASLPTGSTSVTGIVMLSSATNSSATNVAATPSAVKAAYDLAASKSATTGTVTSITLKAGTGISLDTDNTAITGTGTRTITNAGVRATTINGDYLRVNTNGTNADLTIPYATKAEQDADGFVFSSTYCKLVAGTNIPATSASHANLNALDWQKTGSYSVSVTANVQYVDNMPSDYSTTLNGNQAFMMNVYAPLSSNGTTTSGNWLYRIQEIIPYNNHIYRWRRMNSTNGSGTWSFGAWTRQVLADTNTVTTVTTTGSGNAITAITASNGAVTATKGSTFLTSHQDISGKADKSATVSTLAWDSTNKKITKTINGTTSDVVQFAAGSNVTLTGASGKLTIAATNTDTKVNVALAQTSKAYLLGVTTAPTATATAMTAVSDTGVYLDTTAGKLTAGSFAGNGSALTNLNADNLASGTISEDRLPENAKLFKRDIGEYSIASINNSSTTAQPIASGSASVAMGEYTEASGGASTAFGNRGKAIGMGSFVCGTKISGKSESKAIGEGSAIFGASNIVYSLYGVSFGADNSIGDENAYTNGAYSVTYGVGNKITTTGACGFITGGNNKITKGTCGTIFGSGNIINEGYGTAFGQSNIVNGKFSTIIGKYNEADTTVTDSNANGTYSFMIGNGTADDARSNAMEVSWAGDVNAQTSLSVAKAVSMVYNATTNALDFVFA